MRTESVEIPFVWLLKSTRVQIYIRLGWKLTKTAFSQLLITFLQSSKQTHGFLEKEQAEKLESLTIYPNFSMFGFRMRYTDLSSNLNC